MNGAYHESSWTGAGDSTSGDAFAVRRFCGEMSDGRILRAGAGMAAAHPQQRAIDCIRNNAAAEIDVPSGVAAEASGISSSISRRRRA